MRPILVVLIYVTPLICFSQKNEYKGPPSLVWPKLYQIQFTKDTDKLGEFDRPVFSAAVKSLAGKRVSLPGYMVPFDSGSKSKSFMLSSLPLNACFFCGVGGPETVIQVVAKREVTYTEKPVEIEGILRLNDIDPERMIYILEEAEMIGEVEY